jgi:FkbM family methyltransferase
MTERPQLSVGEQLAHACTIGSIKQTATALAVPALSRLAPGWLKVAPWYVGRAIERLNLPVTVDRNRFDVPAGRNATFMRGLLWLGMYETLERRAVLKWLPRDLPVVELGASIGVVSCLVNRRLADPTRHVCVEANPIVVPVLTANRDANGCRFTVVHAAVAYGGDIVEFNASDDIVDSTVLEADGRGRKVAVRTIHLRQLLRDAGFDRCTLICDIEGAEGALIAQEADVLRDSVDTLIIEVHPQHLGLDGVDQIYERLLERGFAAHWRRGDVWVLSKRRSARG